MVAARPWAATAGGGALAPGSLSLSLALPPSASRDPDWQAAAAPPHPPPHSAFAPQVKRVTSALAPRRGRVGCHGNRAPGVVCGWHPGSSLVGNIRSSGAGRSGSPQPRAPSVGPGFCAFG